MTDSALLKPHVLREYALLGDGERGALLGPRGDITWMCAPRWHSASVFSTLAGGVGTYAVSPRDRFVWGGYYEPRSLIWRSRWVTTSGVIECREALAYPADEHRLVLLRTVHALDRTADVDVTFRPRGSYDTAQAEDVRSDNGVWSFRCGDLYGRWTSGPGAQHRDDTFTLRLDVPPGGHHHLVLELSDQPLPDRPADPHATWQATEAAWQAYADVPEGTLAAGDTVHNLAVLRGLTSRSGGMAAAATTSLPERSEAGRNYDYRYAWIRDQCYAGQAAAVSGARDLLESAVGFVTARVLEHGPDLRPAYTVTGDTVPDERHLDLPGYPGGTDVVGNRAGVQFQLDAFGESLLLFATAERLGVLDTDGARAAEVAVKAVADRWAEPDAGIWELDERAWTHSRLITSAGLRAAGTARHDSAGASWLTLADQIVADTAQHALHPDGRWQRAADDLGLDAALLLPPLRGAVPPGDPRTAATLEAYLRELTVDGYAYRFRHDERPLAEAEGSFLLCGFFVALALQQAGDPVEARAWFERTRAATGPPVLYSEEYDSRQHQMRGNLPQAFVHALMVETAGRLGKELT
ncbi:MAG TPA: glycoside hydrolase family 15 protein [Jatrophihabitans sp.]